MSLIERMRSFTGVQTVSFGFLLGLGLELGFFGFLGLMLDFFGSLGFDYGYRLKPRPKLKKSNHPKIFWFKKNPKKYIPLNT